MYGGCDVLTINLTRELVIFINIIGFTVCQSNYTQFVIKPIINASSRSSYQPADNSMAITRLNMYNNYYQS